MCAGLALCAPFFAFIYQFRFNSINTQRFALLAQNYTTLSLTHYLLWAALLTRIFFSESFVLILFYEFIFASVYFNMRMVIVNKDNTLMRGGARRRGVLQFCICLQKGTRAELQIFSRVPS